jgi:hypothetical protein
MGKYVASVEDHIVLPARVRLLAVNERERARLGRRVPAPVPVRLLIDTGSSRGTLVPGIIRHLGAAFERESRVLSPLGAVTADLCWVCLEFPEAGLASFSEVLVARLPMPPGIREFHGLFGRDLLGRLESFEYQGRRRQYALRDTPGWLGWLCRRL